MIRIDHVTFSYGEENENAGGVHDINLTVEDGQCVVLCGESGCGKTTITRLINGLIPHYYEGKMNGEVWVNGAKVSEQPLYDTAKTVGSVFQNPRSQFFNVDTTSEITFGCENLGQPEQSIRERLDKTIRDFRLEKLMGRNIFHLSGGEKQKIACAGVSIMEPDVLVMDEPSSNLDASSILDLRAILAFWKSQGKTIIVSEHRLYYLRGLADRFIYITGGKVEKDYSAAEFESLTEQQRAKLGLRTFILEDLLPPKALPQAGQQMELRNFCFAYKNEPETLHIRESKIPANRIVGIIGNNGAGKSTFSRCFCGLEKRCGEVIWNGRTYRPKDRLNTCYMVMQEVNHQLFTETVLDEVLISMEEENQEWAEEILAELDLIGFKDRHPMSLSGGQKQRVAIASAIASKRSILFFDEPTSGLDYKHMKEVANVLKQVRDAGITLYVITHDLELLLDCCTDIVHFEDGSIIDKFQMDEAGLEKIRHHMLTVNLQIFNCSQKSFYKLIRRTYSLESAERDCILYTWIVRIECNDIIYAHTYQLLQCQCTVQRLAGSSLVLTALIQEGHDHSDTTGLTADSCDDTLQILIVIIGRHMVLVATQGIGHGVVQDIY